MTRVLETHTHADHVSGHGRLALEHGASGLRPRGRRTPTYPARDARGRRRDRGRRGLRSARSTRRATGPSTAASSSATHCSRATRSSSAPPRDPTSPSRRARAPRACSTASSACSSSPTTCGAPGHVAGSLCGVGMSPERASTIGQERRFNPALALATVEEFVADSASVDHAAAAEHGAHRRAQSRAVRRLGAADSSPSSRDGRFVLDVRDADAYAAGHVQGAINVPVERRRRSGRRRASSFPQERPIALHADSPEQADAAQRRLNAVGFFDIAGYLADPEATETLEPIEVDELERALDRRTPSRSSTCARRTSATPATSRAAATSPTA